MTSHKRILSIFLPLFLLLCLNVHAQGPKGYVTRKSKTTQTPQGNKPKTEPSRPSTKSSGTQRGTQRSTGKPNPNAAANAAKARIANEIANNMVYVQGGVFTMGATSEQGVDTWEDELPTHQVTLSSFSICRYEVTQREWKAIMGTNPSEFKGDNLPVENVSWDDCQTFIKKLNACSNRKFRLPTEAEWEYAARGGNKSMSYKFAGSNNLDNVACYNDNDGTVQAGQKRANELGLYDMSGNVWEWCQDWYAPYISSSQSNPTGPTSGSVRVIRGGCWCAPEDQCRVSTRASELPNTKSSSRGLRLAM